MVKHRKVASLTSRHCPNLGFEYTQGEGEDA